MLKKILIMLIWLVILGIAALIGIIAMGNSRGKNVYPSKKISISGINTDYVIDSFDEEYEVYLNGSLIASFDNYEEACALCDQKAGSSVKKKGGGNIYENVYRYTLTDGNEQKQYKRIYEAYKDAYSCGGSLTDNLKNINIYDGTKLSYNHRIKGVPLISQYPELHRGCEVTSLCMLINYKGIKTDKTKLASEIFKDNTPFTFEHGVVKYGNPNIGFVGDIYSKDNKGYGVYHKPIYNLLESYFRERAIDITGTDITHLYYFIEKDCPVWVIINSKFKPLSSEYFEKWYTSEGEIEITYSEHSVLITGYDSEYIYFNDPMNPSSERSSSRKDFEEAWKQMGSQAVTVC